MSNASLIGLAVVSLLAPRLSEAATYTVNPTRVYLSAGVPSALITLKNESPEPLRMQIKAHRWTQGVEGDMQLSATEDLIVFPALVTLKAGEERKVRVAASAASGAIEKTYRIYVEELPPTTTEKGEGAGVKILTRMGIPVFLQPARPVATATVRDVGLTDGHVSFALGNTGNSHYIPTGITVRGFSANGEAVADWPVSGWYVLAGSTRPFSVALAAPACERVRSVLIEVAIGETVLKAPLTTPGGACPRGPSEP